MTDDNLHDALTGLYPTPPISPDLAARAFQAATRRHKPRVWPGRLAVAGLALTVWGGVALVNRVRLSQLYLELESATPRAEAVLAQETLPTGEQQLVYLRPKDGWSLALGDNAVSETKGETTLTYYKPWNWLVRTKEIKSRSRKLGGIYPPGFWLRPTVVLKTRKITAQVDELSMEFTEGINHQRHVFWYDTRDHFIVRDETYDMANRWLIHRATSEKISVAATQKQLSAFLPKPAPKVLDRATYRKGLLQLAGETFPVMGDKAGQFNLLQASLNDKGEVFLLVRNYYFQITGAVDDTGRRYVFCPTYPISRGWFDGESRDASVYWLIPLDESAPRTAPKSLTLLSNNRQEADFWTARTRAVTIPFPTAKCPALPEWTVALDSVPQSPRQLETARLLARGNEAFWDNHSTPETLQRWYERLVPHAKAGEPMIPLMAQIWLSRLQAETGDAKASYATLAKVAHREAFRGGEALQYHYGTVKRSPRWRAATSDLWKAVGLPLD
ncbi:hypothetical protein [Armatimonas rosea]|uniref:Uncharacterized protein n=1 Tax=Armatimonas rosea TaxID=685828 RepID=A0A7W9SY11_ARMRO|nr:hypothetical protein [Armatimonas rosea]MBB6053998.1 hypothetical protein [Armatimonas rosea]